MSGTSAPQLPLAACLGLMRVAGSVLSRNADGIVDKTGLALFTICLLNTDTLLLLGHGMVTPRVGTG